MNIACGPGKDEISEFVADGFERKALDRDGLTKTLSYLLGHGLPYGPFAHSCEEVDCFIQQLVRKPAEGVPILWI
jgi:hypothetical protein